MNQILVNINFKNEQDRISTFANDYANDYLKIKVNRIPIWLGQNIGLFHNTDSNRITTLIGYITNIDQLRKEYKIDNKSDIEFIDELFDKINFKLPGILEGNFTIFIWDETDQAGYFFQDKFSSSLPLYYFKNDTELVISSSLKEILKVHTDKRKLCKSAVKDYLVTHTFVPNETTLIEDVYKMTPGYILAIEKKSESVVLKKIEYDTKPYSLKEAKEKLIPKVKDNTFSLVDQLKSRNFSCALSGGYDSNLVLKFLSEKADSINAFTIGGKNNSEIGMAKSIGQKYNNLKHFTKIVEEERFGDLADIIWRTDGYVCERGLFLQYELAKELQKQKIDAVFFGETADQIFDQTRYNITPRAIGLFIRDSITFFKYIVLGKVWTQRFHESRLSKYMRNPSLKIKYDVALEYILKKNGTMLNSFNIQGLYPFLSGDLVEMSKTLGKKNAKKKYYKQVAVPFLGKEIHELLSKKKLGGSTEIDYLLESDATLVGSILDSDFFRPYINKKRINELKSNMKIHSDLILKLIFLYIFNELFVSGNYDSNFDNNDFNPDFKGLF